MGPRSIERGSMPAVADGMSRSPGFNGAALDRARKCSRAENTLAKRVPLQWGRARSSAEVHDDEFPVRGADGELQWGRARSSAEVRVLHLHRNQSGERFNGAALDRARKRSEE